MTDISLAIKRRIRHFPILSRATQGVRQCAAPGVQWINTHLGPRTGRRFASASSYFSRNRVAGYIGWVGNGNVGDEAIFLAFRRLFPRYQALLYDRAPFELLLHRRFVSGEPFYDFVTLGGGTLFSFRCYYYQLDNALHKGVPVWTFGTGLDDPELLENASYVPCGGNRREHQKLLRDFAGLLHDVPLVTVRGPRTARVLRELGLPGAQVIGDPALGACEAMDLAGGKRAAINLAMIKHRSPADLDRVTSALQSAVRFLLAKGWSVDYIPTARGDRAMGRKVVRGYFPERVAVLPQSSCPQKLINRLQEYDLVIGERLHSLVLAAGNGVPCIGLEYSPKCRDFMESIGMERFCLDSRGLTPDELIGAIEEADRNRAQINLQLNARCNAYRRKQRDASAQVSRLIAPIAVG